MFETPLLVQLVVILAAVRVCGYALRWLGQPAVVGEMVAGIVLGPLVIGSIFPGLHAALFAPDSLEALNSLGKVGLVLFMFIVGAELRMPVRTRTQLFPACCVGLLSMVVPAVLALAIAPTLYARFAAPGVAYWPFALFLAVALAITAFPVLARIIRDREATDSGVGQLALSAAAVVDVVAWGALAFVMALIDSRDGLAGFLRTTGGLAVLLAFAMGVLKPAYAYLLSRKTVDGPSSVSVLTTLLIGLFACSALSEWFHLHPVFGAFLFGVCLPRDDRLLSTLIERIEYVAIAVLMPVFFALAGLSMTAGSLTNTSGAVFALLLIAAIAGKLAGAGAGARLAGCTWRDSLAVGILMNTRGLMELVVIKIGLDAGVIGPELYTMLMIIAVLTTSMTGPLLTILANSRNTDIVNGRTPHADTGLQPGSRWRGRSAGERPTQLLDRE